MQTVPMMAIRWNDHSTWLEKIGTIEVPDNNRISGYGDWRAVHVVECFDGPSAGIAGLVVESPIYGREERVFSRGRYTPI